MDILQGILEGFYATSLLEVVAVLSSITYLILAMRENQWCWPFAFVGTAIYVYLFWNVFLFMDSILHVYYLAMAVYGWMAWQKKKNLVLALKTTDPDAANKSKSKAESNAKSTNIQTWPLRNHLIVFTGVIIASFLSGYFLDQYSKAAWPYLDSFTTWGSVVTTYMVTQKVIENWLYWIVIDTVAMLLYIDRGLYFTALLFFAYVIIVIVGYFNWRARLNIQNQNA